MPLKQQSGRLPTGSTRRWMDDNLSRSRRLVYVRDVSAPRQIQKQIVCRERGNCESSSHSKQPFDSRQLYEEIVLHTVQLRVTGVPFHPICGEQADGVVSNHGVSVRPNRVR